tara:strand:- start:1521 stop:1838 length:318 start_codon:yes stop_codon:yes gene_type:complete
MSDEMLVAEEYDPFSRRTRVRVTSEVCIEDNSMCLVMHKKLKEHEQPKPMRVRTPWGVETRMLRYMELEIKFEPVLRYVDVVTGTIYDPDTNMCNTAQLRLLGDA